MYASNFKDLECWKEAEELVLKIYQVFRANKDFEFKTQIQSAAVSTMSNIAEGYERFSKVEFARFLRISLGSNAEVRSLIHLGHKLSYCNKDQYDDIEARALVLAKKISKLVHTLT